MAELDDLDTRGIPVIDLPEDIGDGPFMSAPADPNVARATQAATSEVFHRDAPFQDNILTDNVLLGPSSHISLGIFHVSDTIQPGQFRRVHQTFTHRPSRDLD